jgi:hypothetical protein
MTIKAAFERTSERRWEFTSKTRIERGLRIVHEDKESESGDARQGLRGRHCGSG